MIVMLFDWKKSLVFIYYALLKFLDTGAVNMTTARNDHNSVPISANVSIKLTAGKDSTNDARTSLQYAANIVPSLKINDR